MRNADEFTNAEVQTASGEHLFLETQLGDGAEGCVYRTRGAQPAAVKIFDLDKRNKKHQKIRAMLSSPPEDPTLDAKGFRSIIWPSDPIETPSEDFLGYRMPYIDLKQQKNALQYAVDDLDWESSSRDDRYKAAINLATTVAVIHRQGHAIGDMNEQNIYVKDGYTSLIDCDSYHIRGTTQYYPGTMEYKRYSPPSGRGETLRKVRSADRFGLGIHIFQFLMNGFHPYAAKGDKAADGDLEKAIQENSFPHKSPEPDELEPPTGAPDYSELPSTIQNHFERCFIEGKRRPGYRPKPVTWVNTLKQARSELTTGGQTLSQEPAARLDYNDDRIGRPSESDSSLIDIDKEVHELKGVFPQISKSDFYHLDNGNIGAEVSFIPSDCTIDEFEVLIEYTPKYPTYPPRMWVTNIEIDDSSEFVVQYDEYGNSEINYAAPYEWTPALTGYDAAQMMQSWIKHYCGNSGNDASDDGYLSRIQEGISRLRNLL